MKRINNNSDQINFIGSWFLTNNKLSDRLIEYFEKNTHLHRKGVMGGGRNLNFKKKKNYRNCN